MVSVSWMAKVLKGPSDVVTIEKIGGSSVNLIHMFISFPSDVESHGLSNLQRAWRIWLTDRQLSSIALDLRDDLGDWIRCRITLS